jgi:hypothetical protein
MRNPTLDIISRHIEVAMDVDMSSCQPAVELVQAADPAASPQGKAVPMEEKLGEVVNAVCEMVIPASDVRTEETRTGDQQPPGPCASSGSGTVAEHNNSLGSKVNNVS